MVRDRVVALERPGIGDLDALGDDRERIEQQLRVSYPTEKDGTGLSRDALSDEAQRDISQRPAFFELKIAGDEFRALIEQAGKKGAGR